MIARDVIGGLVAKVYSGAPFPSKRSLDRAIDVLDALEAAGYRILGPDELDLVTVERCAKYHDDQADGYRTHDPLSGEDPYEFQIRFHECSAGQIRSLFPTQPEAKEASHAD